MVLKGQPFIRLCEESEGIDAQDSNAVRGFFEGHFEPRRLVTAGPSGRNQNTITGYYEPVLKGSRTATDLYRVPLYKTPADLVTVKLERQYPALQSYRLRGRLVQTENGFEIQPYPSRAELDTQGLLKGREIAWVTDPVEAFFLQIQGSGKIQLEDGSYMRLGYANQNGHPYVSIGRWLVNQGELTLAQASMQGIQAWLARNPHRQNELLHQNPSMVFFRELPPTNDPTEGPLGSLGVPLTANRSVAVDPRYVALGLPLVLTTRLPGEAGQRPQAITRLVFAQDTGSAIQGPHRGDFFFGSGPEAGQRAGRMKYDGEMVVLIPKGLQGY
jgi:membrane-bound lytic murein transglycosylase A